MKKKNKKLLNIQIHRRAVDEKTAKKIIREAELRLAKLSALKKTEEPQTPRGVYPFCPFQPLKSAAA